jgi:hypothetical protein
MPENNNTQNNSQTGSTVFVNLKKGVIESISINYGDSDTLYERQKDGSYSVRNEFDTGGGYINPDLDPLPPVNPSQLIDIIKNTTGKILVIGAGMDGKDYGSNYKYEASSNELLEILKNNKAIYDLEHGKSSGLNIDNNQNLPNNISKILEIQIT